MTCKDILPQLPITLLKWKFITVFREHCVKSIHIRSYSGLHFPAFGLNTERYGVSLRIQSECGKMRTRITLNTDSSRSGVFIYRLILGRINPTSNHMVHSQWTKFRSELTNILDLNIHERRNIEFFKNIFLKVLNKHAPIKTKYTLACMLRWLVCAILYYIFFQCLKNTM